MLTSEQIAIILYNITLAPMIILSLVFITFSFINLIISRKKEVEFPELKELPFISVQIPTFNDPIAKRCVEKCMEFDYPKDKYEIIIVDDSTNEQTQRELKKYADQNPGFIKYSHRTNRHAFKPGALNEAMPITRGEILVVFDADWIPKPDFLSEIVKPFSDPKIAIVQSRQGFYNANTNLITRFAAFVLLVYHTVVMPINKRINCVFFCGTAGAIRRSAFDEVGGWNLHSITEDSDLAVRLLKRGYKTTYLEMETPSEVPDTFESLIRQQMRWSYGNIRVWIDNSKDILFGKGFTLRQRAMITYITMANVIAPIVVFMTFFGMLGWFLGEDKLFQLGDIWELTSKILYTSGFFLMGALALFKRKELKEFPAYVASVFTIGLIIAASNSIAAYKAVTNQKLHWHCTPKIDNSKTNIK
ncbi:glycosyltransferase [Candidatus Woesearchaeota archaeon]|nr:glycosyltransferase [Candidatus Woesearchaeota archaeon]